MSFRKLLGVMSIVIIVMFSLMLTTSYAWYSYEKGSTKFSAVTNNEDVIINYQRGQYIAITNAVPIASADVDEYSEKNSFTLQAKKDRDGNEMVATISLKDISISSALKSSYFKIELYQNGTKKTTIAGNNIGTSTSKVIGNYTFSGTTLQSFEIRVYLLDSGGDQSSLMNQTFKAKIDIVVTSRVKSTLTEDGSFAKYIQDLYNNGTKTTVNIAGNSSKPKVTLNQDKGIMLDNNGEYRYYGANPNNYVTFNGESWRIISVSNVKKNESDTRESQRVKLIRTKSIGNYSYDSTGGYYNGGVNDWSQSDLVKDLNDLYYNQKSGTCYQGSSITCNFSASSSNKGLGSDARKMIDNVLYYLGGGTDRNLYANDYYDFERGSTVFDCVSHYGTSFSDDGACPRATRWLGKVGIMYPSDYAYATDLSVCKKDGYNYNSDTTNCTGTDWLLDASNNQWTISPVSSIYDIGFYVSTLGKLATQESVNDYVNQSRAVRPVVYLKADVVVVSGEGTISSPYQLK